MTDGSYVYFTIQFRQTHKSPWSRPDGPLTPVEDLNWKFCSWDYFGPVDIGRDGTGKTRDGGAIDLLGHGDDRQPANPTSHEEINAVYHRVGNKGWWSLRHAAKALQRARKADRDGEFNQFDRDGHEAMQVIKHEFRIVRISVSRTTKPVDSQELLDAVLEEE